MLTVPTYRPQVQSQGLPSARLPGVDAGAMGAGLGAGVAQVGNVMAGIAIEERRKKIETEVGAAINGLDAAAMENTRAARDPARGIKGATAKDDVSRFLDEFDKRQRDVEKGITDPEARQAFAMRAAQRRNSYAEGLMSHADGVVLGYENEQDAQTLTLADERAALNYDNPGELSTARADKEAALARLAERNGWTPERLAVEKTQRTSAMHREVLRGYLGAGRMTEAKSYLDNLKPEEMTANDREVAQKTIGQQADAAKAQALADEAHALIHLNKLKPTEVEAWLKEKSGESLTIRDGARTRFKVLESTYEQATAAEVNKAGDEALRLLEESGGDVTRVEESPEIVATFTKYAPGQMEKLRKIAKDMKPKATTDDMARLDLYSVPPEEMAGMSKLDFHAKYRGRFSDSDWAMASDYWGKAQQMKTNAAAKAAVMSLHDGARSERQVIDQTLAAAGFNPKFLDAAHKDMKTGGPQAQRALLLASSLDKAISEEKRRMSQEVGKPVTELPEDRLTQVVSRWQRANVKMSPTYAKYNLIQRFFADEASGVPLPITASDVPQAWRVEAEKAFREKQKPPPSDEQILDFYQAAMQDGASLPGQ